MEGLLDDAEYGSVSESWWIFLDDDGPNFFLAHNLSEGRDFEELQKNRFLGVRSLSQINQITRIMARNRFSPLPFYASRSSSAPHVLIFPGIDHIGANFPDHPIECFESAVRCKTQHFSRFLQSFTTITTCGGFYSLLKYSEAGIRCLTMAFPNLKAVLVPQCWPKQTDSPEPRKDHYHADLLIVEASSYGEYMHVQDLHRSATVLKPLWEKHIRLIGTRKQTDSLSFEDANSRENQILELVQTSQGLRMRMLDPECPHCKV
ncbi:hypothetical protein GCG54_00011975 [Colletotrichum gloeosporioides]|uniref:Uncharacterized protein n=1 Tax=Colletotrichum gloeosporioides TaxID=474922 RepID=A0A8H4CPM0_COLGL|nr:uncharacterized protein GCG54_00011975 [Colletotrichum gloeosporioides]KAF3807577.1 hypothetical protein GCG54_00011975 [Colletotrichum gloeosporioides]